MPDTQVVNQPRRPHTAPKSLAVIWGESLKARRLSLGNPPLSRAQVAKLAHITTQSVWLFETGQRIPLDRTKVDLARALGTTPEELFPWPAMSDMQDGRAA